jgi:hypothetical protein
VPATSPATACVKCGTELTALNRVANSLRCVDCDAEKLAVMQRTLNQLTGVIQTKRDDNRTHDYLAFPVECTQDDVLGDMARDTAMPMGLAYPAVLACMSVKPDLERMCGARINLYSALIVRPGGGKNETIRRALVVTGLTPGIDYSKSAPGGDSQLVGLLGDRPAKQKDAQGRIPGPSKLLLVTNEIGDVLSKTGIENSTLATRLCDFWDENEYDKQIGKEVVHVDCRLSWLGGLPADVDNPEKFREFFGGQTNFGLYPRFLFGYADGKYVHTDWAPPKHRQVAKVILPTDDEAAEEFARINNGSQTVVRQMSPEATQLYDEWTPSAADNEGRLKYNAKKIAILKACANDEETVSGFRMQQAIRFMQWQIRIRETFKPGEAEKMNRQAWFTERLTAALERAGAKKKFVNWRRISLDNRWDNKIDAGVQLMTVDNLVKLGRLIEEPEEEDDKKKRGRRKEYPWVMMHDVPL